MTHDIELDTTPNLRTQYQTMQILQDVGLGRRQAKIGSAIAMCESPDQTGNANVDFGAIADIELADPPGGRWGYSYGGLMIRSLQASKGTGDYRDQDRLLEPRFNCRSAKIIRRQAGGWWPWSVFQNDEHLAYMQDALYPGDEDIILVPPGTHLVRSGESLSVIAAGYGTFTWQELARVNGLHEPYTLRIGQSLQLP